MSYGTVQAEKMTTESGYSLGAGNASSFKNRFINGNCAIDQRNAGASSTLTAGTYTLDRWKGSASQTSKATVQQNAGSVTPPAGFQYYLGVTSSSSYSVSSTDYFSIAQLIEGNNISDLAWGTANAKTVTLSFWARSSLTGTFGGAFQNSAANRSYPYTYTIDSANTWEYKTVTVTGDTSGTWLTTSGIGIVVRFGLGVGSTYSGTAGAWAATDYNSATGATSIVGTSGATLYITGMQLEVGTVATSFDFRSYGTELNLCMRYYETFSAPAAGMISWGQANGTTAGYIVQTMRVVKRADPTFTTSGSPVVLNATGGTAGSGSYGITVASNNVLRMTATGWSGLVAGNAFVVYANGTTSSFNFDSEL